VTIYIYIYILKPTDVDIHLKNLKEKLQKRNYPEILIDKKFSEAKLKDRKKNDI
jgi:hypothetical protein